MIPTVKTLVPKIFDAYEVKKIRSFFFWQIIWIMDAYYGPLKCIINLQSQILGQILSLSLEPHQSQEKK